MHTHVETSPAAKSERFPLRAWAALVAMIVIVAAAGYLMFDRVAGASHGSRELTEIGSRRLPIDFGPRVQPDGVRERGNMYQVKAGEGMLTVSKSGDQWRYNFSYDKPDLVSADQQAAFTARFRLTRDAAYAKSLGVTPDQIKNLTDMPAREGMIVSDTDRQRIAAAFEAYLKAAPPREPQTAALVQALRDVAQNSLGPTRQKLADQVSQIQAILTPQQIEPFKRRAN